MHERRFPKDRFDKFIPNFLNKTDATVLRKIGDSIKKFYFDDKPDLYVDDCLDRVCERMMKKFFNSSSSPEVYLFLVCF